MPLQKYSAETADQLRTRVVSDHGSMAVVRGPIRQVQTSNMLGINRRIVFECDVDVPAVEQPKRFSFPRGLRDRAVDLISEETAVTVPAAVSAPAKAAVPGLFADALAEIEHEVAPVEAPRRPGPRISKKRRELVPIPATNRGDVIVIVGVSGDALTIAHQFSAHYGGAKICTGGELATGIDSLIDRRSVLAARTAATDEGRCVVVAFGIIPGRDYTAELQMLDATQVWAAVDASRKTDDTQVWVALLDESVDVDALAVLGTATTQTPTSVNDLRVPIGWVEDEPARESVLSAATAGIVIE